MRIRLNVKQSEMLLLKNLEHSKRPVEKCKNPWNGECRSADIEVYIYYKGTLRPICRDCWSDIAEKDIEW